MLSFVYIGIYWNNHHHLFQVVRRVDGGVLWANLHLLFWLSLYPFTTAWMDESHLAQVPVVAYGVNLLAAGTAFYVLEHMMARIPASGRSCATPSAARRKEQASVVLYVVGILLALFTEPWVGLVPYVVVALIWVVPDRRVERYLARQARPERRRRSRGACRFACIP